MGPTCVAHKATGLGDSVGGPRAALWGLPTLRDWEVRRKDKEDREESAREARLTPPLASLLYP